MNSILYVRLPCQKIYPTGPIYLADWVHKHFPQVRQKILDLSLAKKGQEKKVLFKTIEEFNPEIVAFSWRDIQPFSPDEDDPALENSFKFYYSSNPLEKMKASLNGIKMILFYTDRIKKNLSLVKEVYQNYPGKKFLIGGPAFSVFADVLIKKCPEGTIGVIGEGENVFLKYLAGKNIFDERVVVKENGKLRWGLSPLAKRWSYVPIEEGAPLDFDYIAAIFPEFKEYTSEYIGIPTKRGCPYDCLFCLYNFIDGKKVRYRPPETVAQEVETLQKKFGARKIWFSDSQFFPSPRSLPVAEETLDELIKRKLDIEWTSYIRIDKITPTIAKKMIVSGVGSFELSITSGSQSVIDRLRLGFKIDKFFEACQMFKQAGHTNQKIILNLSLNAPGETKETLLETVEAVKKISVIFGEENVRPFIFFLGVQPHTGLAKVAIEEGHLKEGFNPLALNPFIIKNLIYNPPPLGKTVGRIVNQALKNGTEIGWTVLRELEERLR